MINNDVPKIDRQINPGLKTLMTELEDPTTSSPMQELTPQMKEEMPVVNSSRGKRGKLQGVADFFSNEETQMALLAFGRAFDSREGSAAMVLADAGEAMISGQANQRALEAFEQGGDIAGAAGRFADKDTVADLQARRVDQERFNAEMKQIDEQFKETLELEKDKFGLDEKEFTQRVKNDDRSYLLDEAHNKQYIASMASRMAIEEKLAPFELELTEMRSKGIQSGIDQAGAEAAVNNAMTPNERRSTAITLGNVLQLQEEQRANINQEITTIDSQLRVFETNPRAEVGNMRRIWNAAISGGSLGQTGATISDRQGAILRATEQSPEARAALEAGRSQGFFTEAQYEILEKATTNEIKKAFEEKKSELLQERGELSADQRANEEFLSDLGREDTTQEQGGAATEAGEAPEAGEAEQSGETPEDSETPDENQEVDTMVDIEDSALPNVTSGAQLRAAPPGHYMYNGVRFRKFIDGTFQEVN